MESNSIPAVAKRGATAMDVFDQVRSRRGDSD